MSPSVSLMPHSVCWAAAPALIWTMVVTNMATFIAYVSICATLLLLARRTGRVINREWRFFVVGFALFIVACGSTHLLEVITTWSPIFWVDAATNIVTAVLSAYVAIALIRRASVVGFGINDYADRLASTEDEKQRLAEALLSARKLEDWSRMSTVVAHEISNPLEAVQSMLYLIRNADGITPEVRTLAESATEEASRVITISRSTLSFFRHASEPELVDLLASTESVRMLLQPVLQQHELTLDVRSTGNPCVEALPGEPRQVLLNLIRNAVEATQRPGAAVEVLLTGETSAVTIVIRDRGTGIAPQMLPSLFEFGRSTKGSAGNGLGLWTVKHIVSKHGGAIAVVSDSSGTTFTLRWPRQLVRDDVGTSLAAATA